MKPNSLQRATAALTALKLAALQNACFHTWNEELTECIHCKIKINF